ncbi:hypothetical protein Ocin01_00871 [Orchesella cincta]|uniref:Uncharacterized protein n=1 Tax=Orchesella cincta TaxID=48709 RepID=A0A1D2NKK7_ORCCI|nr:hypothetical protein Ocin01_00871 [Orchesella cincta]
MNSRYGNISGYGSMDERSMVVVVFSSTLNASKDKESNLMEKLEEYLSYPNLSQLPVGIIHKVNDCL